MSKFLPLVVLFLISLLPAYQSLAAGILCTDVFRQDIEISLSTKLQRALAVKVSVRDMIQKAQRSKEDPQFARQQALALVEEISTKLQEVKIISEYDTPFYQTFRENLQGDLKTYQQKLSSSKARFSNNKIFELAVRSSLIFSISEKSLKAYAESFNEKNTDIERHRSAYLKHLSENLNYGYFEDAQIAGQVSRFKNITKKVQSATTLLTFENMNEFDLYVISRQRIFVLGLIDAPVMADGYLMLPFDFLIHDVVHMHGFFGYSKHTSLFDLINQRTRLSSPEFEIRWKVLEKKMILLEDRFADLLASGQVHYQESVVAMLFELYHESVESIYLNVSRSPTRYLNGNISKRILEMINSKDNREQSEIQADLKLLLAETQKILVP